MESGGYLMDSKRILLHICCGPCATYPLEVLGEGFSITGFFYNPNIHPHEEFDRRLESTRQAAEHYGIDLQIKGDYPREGFLATAGEEAPGRCSTCYLMRLGQTARQARESGFNGFSTTLLISPYQNLEELIRAGQKVARHWGVSFYAPDFRKGFSRSRELARELNLYRQGYCGCIHSKKERYGQEG